MNAQINERSVIDVSLGMKESGAEVLADVARFSKTIGQAVATKKGLSGDAHTEEAKRIQRTLFRVKNALEEVL